MNITSIDKSKAKANYSSESICYIIGDIVFKVFKDYIDTEERIDVLKVFINNKIDGCPELYDFLYDNNKIVGYAMKYYPNTQAFSSSLKYKFIKEKCLELINIYLNIRDKHNLCYYDFHNLNVRLNNNKILLFDVDGCLNNNPKNNKRAVELLRDYIVSVLYNTFFFDNEFYFLPEERKRIKALLYSPYKKEELESPKCLKEFIENATPKSTQKILRRIPYRISNNC